MPEPREPSAPPEYTRCRHLVHETPAAGGRPAPGRYCESPIGVVQDLDCPVLQGRACCFFAPRAAGEEPSAIPAERLLVLRSLLAEDFLRWPYERRLALLEGREPSAPSRPAGGRAPARGDRRPVRRRSSPGRSREHPPK